MDYVYPTEFEIPNTEDFCRGDMHQGKLSCSLGWYKNIFPHAPVEVYGKFHSNFLKNAKKLNLKPIDDCNDTKRIYEYNDNPENSLEDIATCFSMTIENMGYKIS